MNKPQKVLDDTVKVDVSYGNISEEEGARLEAAIVEAIKFLHKGEVDVDLVGIAKQGLTAEWVGRSTGKGQMELSDEERWKIINKGVEDDRTVLYVFTASFSPLLDTDDFEDTSMAVLAV